MYCCKVAIYLKQGNDSIWNKKINKLIIKIDNNNN